MTKHEEIADALTEEILSRRFRPGERLPSERDLAARFDANRGAVREAMKKIAQLGLASIQPGGARVEPLQNASLDVIGHMLRRTNIPEPALVVEVMEVVSTLIKVAADRVLRTATSAQIDTIRELIRPLTHDGLDESAHTVARMELMRVIMLTSEHLICQLIARSLFEQLIPNLSDVGRPATFNAAAFVEHMQALDTAFATRNRDAARDAFDALEALNRSTIYAALNRSDATPQVVEVSI
ncbi:MAG: GntR family transcriptional regulator [Pseudomonadales bacterium]